MDFLLEIDAENLRIYAESSKHGSIFLHIGSYCDNYYTPYAIKLGFREANRRGPKAEVKNQFWGISVHRADTKSGFSPWTPIFRFSDSKYVWRVAIVSNYQ